MNNNRDSKGRFKGESKIKMTCEICGKELLRHPYRLKYEHQFCSHKCHGEYNKIHGAFHKGHKLCIGRTPWNKGISTEVKVKCSNCGKEKMVRNWQKDNERFFCSNKCLSVFKKNNPEIYYVKRKNVKCKECEKMFTVYNKSEQIFCGLKCKNAWFIKQPEYIEKLRKSKINYIETQLLNGMPLAPTIGKYETSILNYFEETWGYNIIRQHSVAGYFIDGYCPMFHLAIEVDEPHHLKQLEKDKVREQNIIDRVGCSFLRIEVPV